MTGGVYGVGRVSVAGVVVITVMLTVVALIVPPVSTVATGSEGATGGNDPSGAGIVRAAMAARTGTETADAAPDLRLSWPLAPRPEVVRPFDPPDSEYGPGHRGVDLAAAAGQPVSAAAAGRVVYAGDLAGRGVVSIEHAGGLRTTYEPLSPQVKQGERVTAGERIGTVARGHDGCTAEACLHWGLRRSEQYLDPLTAVASAGPLRLKPWPG